MNDAALFEATVPVFRHYLRRVEALLSKLSDEEASALRHALAPDAFSAAGHVACACGFVARTVPPLLGRAVPVREGGAEGREAALALVRESAASLDGLTAADFAGAARRRIRHVAGEAALEQDATTFVTLFALPNFLFHASTAFAILRRAGVDIGKADFDGQHVYAAGAARAGPEPSR